MPAGIVRGIYCHKEKKMANKKIWLGILAIALVFGMTAVGCGDDSTGGNRGIFVLTDIPAAYNGKYAYFEAQNDNLYIVGCQSINMQTETMALVQISNGKASLPVWIIGESGVSRYYGDATFTQDDRWGVSIFEQAALTHEEDEEDEAEPIAGIYFNGTLTLSNGAAEKSANSGTVSPY
jgi:hypothetical protein